jgi:two-component system nitrogen regulation response regulator NtrX
METSLTKERILIVDDEKNIVTSLQEILIDEGYDIVTAEDGLDALEMVQSEPPDLVLLDIWIPGMDGIEVLQAIKTYHPEIEVLVMSGHGTIDTAVKATKLGAYDFIEKPFSLNQLVLSVEKALKQKGKTDGIGNSGAVQHELPHCFEMMVEVKKAVTRASKTNDPLLIQGEAGTGKEYIAQAIHHKSKKSNFPLHKINCALRSMPKIQIELFTHQDEKGLPTKPARGGAGKKTVYLKNIESMSQDLQARLASTLKSSAPGKPEGFIPDRVFFSSTKDLEAMAEKGTFHPELYEILKKNSIDVPPLRDNRALIPTLVNEYFEELENRGKVVSKNFTEESMRALCEYDWPENLKELRSVLEQIARTIDPSEEITLKDVSALIKQPQYSPQTKSNKKGKKGDRPLQRTLKRSVVLCGRGLHSGIKTGLIMQPLPPGSGIIFGDISSGSTIPAKVENVQSTEYATSLRKGYASVSTIEHIMATLHMYRVHNLLIKIGDEAPVMDGSAKDFCQLIEDGDFEEQDEAYEELVIDKTYTFGPKEEGGAHISIEPYDGFKVSYHMEYPAPIGIMEHTFEFKGADSFKEEIAPARTFGFVKDVAMLNKMGFGVGGKLDNFILLGDEKVLNTTLRYENEFARHKILDILGDFYLLGKPIRGYIKAHKSGHTQNIGLLKTIKEDLTQAVPVH